GHFRSIGAAPVAAYISGWRNCPMTARKSGKFRPKVEKLELNRETLQDLTENETEEAKGGAFVGPTGLVACPPPRVGERPVPPCARSPAPSASRGERGCWPCQTACTGTWSI